MLVTDVGFVLYWVVTALQLIPPSWAFRGYDQPVLVAWNWSFLPLDLCISATGITALLLHRRSRPTWLPWTLVSLVLTFCSGLQALSFWAFASDFAWAWWAPNGFLLLYPLPFAYRLIHTSWPSPTTYHAEPSALVSPSEPQQTPSRT